MTDNDNVKPAPVKGMLPPILERELQELLQRRSHHHYHQQQSEEWMNDDDIRRLKEHGLPVPLDAGESTVGKRVVEEQEGLDYWYCFFDDNTVRCLGRRGELSLGPDVPSIEEYLRDLDRFYHPGARAALDAWEDEFERKEQQAQEHAERAEYERLKAKFGETPQT